jgi:hypothetical protein
MGVCVAKNIEPNPIKIIRILHIKLKMRKLKLVRLLLAYCPPFEFAHSIPIEDAAVPKMARMIIERAVEINFIFIL